MRTPLAPLLSLLAPVAALAQAPMPGPIEEHVTRTPTFWFWMVLLAIAVFALVWVTVNMSRRRRGPPPGSGPRTPQTPRPV